MGRFEFEGDVYAFDGIIGTAVVGSLNSSPDGTSLL